MQALAYGQQALLGRLANLENNPGPQQALQQQAAEPSRAGTCCCRAQGWWVLNDPRRHKRQNKLAVVTAPIKANAKVAADLWRYRGPTRENSTLWRADASMCRKT